MMKILYTLSLAVLVTTVTCAQGVKTKVSFTAEDGIEITADKYLINEEYPYILLFHQAGSSRGEYNDIAERFLKLRYNCLAVDLRSGDNSNYVRNETAQRAGGQNSNIKYLDALQDIRASIDFAWGLNPKELILLGSSYSASLVLIEGKENQHVKAVIAFSPGEYFGDDLRMEEALDSTWSKPLFIAVTKREESYVRQMMNKIPDEGYTLFLPETAGVHGARALWEDSPSKDEYWLALLLFVNNLNK
ncbi:alpha/beta hydrolase [Bacteroidota bacterium]